MQPRLPADPSESRLCELTDPVTSWADPSFFNPALFLLSECDSLTGGGASQSTVNNSAANKSHIAANYLTAASTLITGILIMKSWDRSVSESMTVKENKETNITSSLKGPCGSHYTHFPYECVWLVSGRCSEHDSCDTSHQSSLILMKLNL